jgi:glycosyltransferase involved in cell wall biosynthesis
MPQVTVVITTYNSLKYLPETLDSVLQQTFTDFEVLLVDDGSTDSTVQWASGIVDPRVRLITQENQGVSVARNTGITNACGEYIAFLDGDDIWEPTKLEKQVSYLQANQDVSLVHTWLALINEEGNFIGRFLNSHAEGNIWEHIIQKNTVVCSSVMVRRCCFEKVGGFDSHLRVAEDWDMWIRIAKCYRFGLLKEPLIRYRQLSNSKSKKYPSRLQDFQRIIEKAFQTAPVELLYLKNRSYGQVNLGIARKCLQCQDKNCQMANDFRRKALQYYPQIRFSQEYISLSLALALIQFFGVARYEQVQTFLYSLRRRYFAS